MEKMRSASVGLSEVPARSEELISPYQAPVQGQLRSAASCAKQPPTLRHEKPGIGRGSPADDVAWKKRRMISSLRAVSAKLHNLPLSRLGRSACQATSVFKFAPEPQRGKASQKVRGHNGNPQVTFQSHVYLGYSLVRGSEEHSTIERREIP